MNIETDPNRVEPTPPEFFAETTRVHNKNIAPAGKIYFVVKCNGEKGKKYISSILLPTDGLTDEIRENIFKKLSEGLIKKFSL